ncbi:hypothetical protein [Rhodoblastus sp.]|uniref:hypothetical protein n=1 Tax=Rhodoblastus sp. TaxID=1962975 RepID=UPI0035AF5CCA
MSAAPHTTSERGPLAAPFVFARAQKITLSALQQVEKTPKPLCASRQAEMICGYITLKNNDKQAGRGSGICVATFSAGQSFEGLS